MRIYLYACEPAMYMVKGTEKSYNLKLFYICYDTSETGSPKIGMC